ncbi:amidohydrolase family protein [Sphingomonas sp. CLY1604]|uniref:amidohydrolase family protein n=1 Tax=Sphingomonas sp. CLY1604 TaxID=3457786 RepID=UPI003FD7862B
MRDIPFVDAHVHFWDLARLRYPWLTPPFADDGPNGSVEAIAKTYLPHDYRRDAASWNIAGVVHVEAGADATHAAAETFWLERLDDPPAGIVAQAALNDPELEPLLETHAAHGRVRGVRHIVNWHTNPTLSYTDHDVTEDPAWERGFARLADHGLSFDLQAYPSQFARLVRIIARSPETQVVINHLGMPVPADPDGRATWSDGLRRFAELPNVAIKISGFGFVRRPWTTDDARPWILEAIDIFGAGRACVASDFPTDGLFGTFDATLDTYAAILEPFSADERRALWGGNANRLYRLGLELKDRDNG